MACNCSGNTYNISMGCCVPVVANADNYYTKSEVDEKIEEVIISGGVTSGEVQTMIDNSIVNKADKSEIPTVPTSNTAFTNDAGYLTEHQSLSNYYTKAETSGATQISTALSNKADNTTLNNYLLKNKIWCGTQAEYDEIINKDSETLYLIHG